MMLVDVVLMRRDGVKLPAAVVKSAAPSRGRLVFVTIPWRGLHEPHNPRADTTFARLLVDPPPTSADERLHVLPELRDGRFRSWDGDQGVIVGIESSGDFAVSKEYPQAWWCRLVR